MKKITLLMTSLMIVTSATSLFAQNDVDVTPSKFVFTGQNVGPFVYDGVADAEYTTNATSKNPLAKSDTGGYTYLMGWSKISAKNGVDQGNTGYMRTMSNIIDLGGEVGKVLCFKGHECSDDVFPYGIKPTADQLASAGIEWPSMALFFGYKMKGTNYEKKQYKARLSITWRICLPPDEYSDSDAAFSVYINDYSINMHAFQGSHNNKDGGIDCVSYETEDEDVWCTQEVDFTFNGDDEQIPLLLKFAFGRYTTIGALLIKEIKLTINPSGDPVWLSYKTLAMNPPTSIKNEKTSPYSYTVVGNNVSISNLAGEKVTIYDTVGNTVTSFTATQSTENIPLFEKGIYILQIGNERFKILK